MSLGSQTQVVDGQRNTFPTSFQYQPASYGPQTTGVPNVSPTMPPFISAANSQGGGSAFGLEGVGGYGTAGNNSTVTAIAAANPWNPKASPLVWAIVFLIVGLVLLKGIHWRETTLEGFEEEAHLGPARERAEESA